MPFAQYNKGGGASKWGASSRSKNDDPNERVTRQIENAKTRIEDAGYKTERDKRNWLEKATNLPEGQNAFFDTLDLLWRPGQAVLNTIDKLPEGRLNIGETAWRGFSGKDKVHGSEIVGKKFDDKKTKFILGTALDIATDPLNLVPAGAIVKGVKAVAKPIGRGTKATYGALENTLPKLRGFRENTVQPAAQKTKDSLGYMFNRDYKIDETLTGGKNNRLRDLAEETENTRTFMQDEHALNLGNVAKTTGIDAGKDVGRLMEKNLKQFEEIPLNSNQLKQIGEIDTEVNNIIPQRKSVNEQIKDVKAYHKQQIFDEYESPLIKQIKAITGGKMIRTSEMVETKQLPSYLKRNDGLPLDEVANELGYNYASELVQDLKGITANRPKSSQLNAIAKQRMESDEYYKQLLEQKGSYQEAIKTLNASKAEIKPEVRELIRPEREIPTDPKVQEASRNLMKSNQVLRDYALANEIKISEIEGYMTHILSKEERSLREKGRVLPIDRGSFGQGNPNKKILNQRELKGSVEDINEQVGRNFFEPNAYFATAIGQKRLIDYIQAVSFRKKVLQDTNFAMPYQKGMDIPPNAVIVDTHNYTFIREGEGLEEIADTIGGKYVVTKQAKQLLDRYKQLTTDEGTKAFLNAFDRVQSWWKRAALFSVPYHLRNDVGAKFNNWVGGMNAADLVKYSAIADKEVYQAIIQGKETALFREFRQQGLGNSGLSQVEFAVRGEVPEKAIERTVKNLSKTTSGKIKQRLNPLHAFETSREFGNFIDQTNRFSLYKWAKDKGMSPKDAAAKVREVQFDYTKLAPFEREVMARIVPFYRWMRNNIPFQIKQFVNDPRKYARVNQIRMEAQESVGIDDKNVPVWMKESFAIPVSGDGSGSGKFLGLNLPLGDLAKLSKPGKVAVDSVSPLLKLPAELSLNRNFFYNKPIKNFEGQEKQFQVPGTNLQFGIPSKLAYAGEQLTGQIGRGFSSYLQRPEDVDQDTKFRTPSLGVKSVFKDYDAVKSAYFEKMKELQQLQDYIDYIEQQTGQRPRTINEIK